MKKIIYVFLVLGFTMAFSGCTKFLNVDPPNDLSGNNFWRNKTDVERYVNGLYELFRKSVYRLDMTAPPGVTDNEFPFFSWSGDFRGAPVKANSPSNRVYITRLANNNLWGVIQNHTWVTTFNPNRFMYWDYFYKVIASANIAIDRIPTVADLSESDKKRYLGEAAFMRNICYFFMVRLWGDVPYYTEPYFTGQLKRLNQVEVLKNCLDDIGQYQKGMPWSYNDQTQIAVRAMRGSAIVLMMHMNMWLAGFDASNANKYYGNVVSLGNEFHTESGSAYELLPLNRTSEIFKGRSKEGLFEIPQNTNYGESFGWSAFSDNVLYAPYKTAAVTTSYVSYDPQFMNEIFPATQDDRKNYWYDSRYMYNGDNKFLMLKFANVYANQNAEDVNPDDNQTVFRLPDVYLLEAEAQNKLGNDVAALAAVNTVRGRANAPALTSGGADLEEDIFFERCRELMGEAHYWYDVVRTKRIINPSYDYGFKCTVSEFAAGAWTWPLSPSVQANNPGITLNNYWQ